MYAGVLRCASRKRGVVAVVLALFCAVEAHAGPGLDWLKARQNVDGSHGGGPTSLALPPRATAEVLRARIALDDDLTPGFESAMAWLDAHPEVNTEFLARKVTVHALAGRPVAPWAGTLLTHQGPTGGFGHRPGFDPSVSDTARAVEALAAANLGTTSQAAGAVSFLLARQQGNGGWAESAANDASVSLTAVSLRALWPYRSTYAGVAAALTRAQGFLLSRRDASSLWGEDFVSAQALLALVPAVTDLSGLDASAEALEARELPNGSWAEDEYTTALVLQALRAYEARRGGGAPAPTGSVAGYVVRAHSTEPIVGATVSVLEAPGVEVLTNAEGYFVLPGLPAGAYTLTAARAGFLPASVVVQAQAQQVTLAGRLVLEVASQTGLVVGRVLDSTTGQPLSSVQVGLTGPASRSVLTNASGDFDFGPVPPGTYALGFQKTGYRPLSGTATVVAGQTLAAQPSMTPVDVPVDDGPGPVSGRVVDGKTGQPLAGALFALGGGLSATTGADGTFRLASVPRASYEGTLSATGYQGLRFSLAFSAGASGELGTLTLFPVDTTPAPTSLTLRGSVVDGVNGASIGGASVTLVETGASIVTGADGRFVLSGITLKNFSLAVSASGYAPASYTLQIGAFGEAVVELKLSPPGSSATSSTLSGIVSDAVSGLPIEGAQVVIEDTGLSSTTGADGRYSLSGIEPLELVLRVSAVGYSAQTASVTLVAHGSYTLDPSLAPVAGDSFQIVSVSAAPAEAGAEGTVLFTARVASLLGAPQSALVIGEVQDAAGTGVATVTPYAVGTTTPTTDFSFAGGEVKDLTVAWKTSQHAPGAYRLVLRVVEPGTVTRSLPTGVVLAENSAPARIVATRAVSGAMLLNPPLTQAGLPTPVSFSALVRNAGNVPLAEGAYVLTVVHPDSGETLFTAQGSAGALEVGGLATVAFGTWTPMQAGNLQVRVKPVTAGVAGEVVDRLYVGDKATGAFTVSRTVVPEGTQTVRGHIGMQGVDTAQGGSTDPLYAFVKEAVRRGGAYTAPAAKSWHQVNRCLGCHIQTQSLLGLASSFDKADIDRPAAQFLHNNIVSSQYADGSLRISHPEFTRTQTTLGLWSLTAWPDVPGTFRAKYKAAQFLYQRSARSGDWTWWTPDYGGYWFGSDVGHTALTVKGFANLLKDAERPEMAGGVVDYSLTTVGAAGVMSGAQDLAAGPDGSLYVLKGGGTIERVDRVTGQVTSVATGIPGSVSGLAVAEDGTFWITCLSNPTVVRVRPDGTRQDIHAGGYLIDGALGPDGWLYAADYYSHRVLRVSPAGQVETYVSGGLLNYPYSTAFSEGGDLLIANYNGYNLLKVAAADRAVSVFSDGLAYAPQRMTRASDGSLYVTAYQPYSEGLLRVRPDGSAERVIDQAYLRSVAAAGDQVFVTYLGNNSLQEVRRAPLDTALLEPFRAEIPRAVRYFLAGYQDGTSDNSIQALRLIGLAEARPVVTDPVMRAQIDAAITFIANVLRSRQVADGGWGRYWGWGSDPLMTAMVGIALEYTEPSPTDPQIRRAIQYLLATQRADGSWDNYNNGLSTRLASTSFVMVFMPKALERLGGIDVDLRLDLPSNVALSNPTQPPTTVQPGADGVTAYTWRLLGVTGAGRDVDFDLTLSGMTLGEQRRVATRAYLEFDNSFLEDEKVQVPLDVPGVRAASGMTLAVATDASTYPANTPVGIQSTVANTGPTPASGQVVLAIRPVGSTEPVVALPPLLVDTLAPGAQRVLSASWNTGSTLAGPYEVLGRLLDAGGRVLAEGVAPLRIVAPASAVATSVTSDQQVYGAWDVVNLDGRVSNVSANAVLAVSRVELTVLAPGGATVFNATRDVRQLMPGAKADLPFQLHLADAASGTYPVTLVLRDALTKQVLSTSTTSFQVERRPVEGLAGEVTVAQVEVSAGVPNACTDTAWSTSASAVPGVTLVRQLIRMDTGAVVDEARQTVDLTPWVPDVHVRTVSTTALAEGDYACALQAEVGGRSRTLGFASFRVTVPAVHFTAALTRAGKGRLLVFLDAPVEGSGHDNDTYGPTGAPGLLAQKAFLEALLTHAGWSYTIVMQDKGEKRFAQELRTGGYTAYALFTEFFKLDPQVLKELREAVFRGEGLLIAGDHDSRHATLQDALGVKYTTTTVSQVDKVVLDAAEFPLLHGEIPVLTGEKPLRLDRLAAQSLGRYHVTSGAATLDAVTLNAYGEGEAATTGMDLLAIATRDGQTSLAADVLRALLDRVSPATPPTGARAVIPLQLDVANQGVDVEVATSVTLPAGATVVDAGAGQAQGSTLSFVFPLAAGASRSARFWVRLPEDAGTVAFQAVAQGGPVTVTSALSVDVTRAGSLTQVQTRITALVAAGHPSSTALKKANVYVGRAIAETWPDLAIQEVIKAVDALVGLTDAKVVEQRAALGVWLREATQGLAAPH